MRPSESHIFGSKDWQKDQRWKRLRPSGLVKRARRYSSKAHDDAMEAIHLAELADADRQEVLFMADPTDIRWLKLNHQLLFTRG